MKRIILTLAALSIAAATLPALADAIPYPHGGSIAPTSTIKASATGDVIGYFYSSTAADTDEIELVDETTHRTSVLAFDNQTTTAGTSFDFGPVNAGDTLAFNLVNLSTSSTFSSDPALSQDHVNHAYLTPYTGGFAGIPPGTYVGTEDEPNGSSDFNYNDDDFVFTNVSATPAVPEPGSIALLGTGMLAMGNLVRRRFASR